MVHFTVIAQDAIAGLLRDEIAGSHTGLFGSYGAGLIWLFSLAGLVLAFFSNKKKADSQKKENEHENQNPNRNPMRQEVNKYRLILDAATDPIYLATEEGKILLMNEATCSVSGYRREELKNINLNRLRVEQDEVDPNGVFGNGKYRYKETWKTRSGDTVSMDMVARSIQVGSQRLLLYVGREMDANFLNFSTNPFKKYCEKREMELLEIARLNKILCDQFIRSSSDSIRLGHQYLSKFPEEAGHMPTMLTNLKEVKDNLQLLSQKYSRDLWPNPCKWDLNDVVRQELCSITMNESLKKLDHSVNYHWTSLQINSTGKWISATLGTVLEAAYHASITAQNKQIVITTKEIENKGVVEIRIPSRELFLEALGNILFPESADAKSPGKISITLETCQSYLVSQQVQVQFQANEPEKWVITFGIPCMAKKEEISVN